MVFPNGRLVNQPLRTALTHSSATRTFADYGAIDSAICSYLPNIFILGIYDS